MNLFVRSFLIIYFYLSIVIASINSFQNLLNNFVLTKKHLILYTLFPLTFIIESFIYVFYIISIEIQKKLKR